MTVRIHSLDPLLSECKAKINAVYEEVNMAAGDEKGSRDCGITEK